MRGCRKANLCPSVQPYTLIMDRLWTPWRYNYITGSEPSSGEAGGEPKDTRKGVPPALRAWPGQDAGCVFCNLIQSVEWGIHSGRVEDAERAGWIVARRATCFVCLNAFPYASGHLLIVPYRHTDSLAKLPTVEAEEMIRSAQTLETMLRELYQPDGINLGINLGKAAGAGVAEHLHVHQLPRWFGDVNFMTAIAETRILPEELDVTWTRLRAAVRWPTEAP